MQLFTCTDAFVHKKSRHRAAAAEIIVIYYLSGFERKEANPMVAFVNCRKLQEKAMFNLGKHTRLYFQAAIT